MTILDKNVLIQAAIEARQNSHAPYSKFKVGAALLTASGEIFAGCNVENHSYGLTVCAERNAIYKAVSEGKRDFLAMAIVADTPKPVLPCGACRQVIAEFNRKLNLILANVSGDVIEYSLDALLPHPFQMD